MNCAVHSEIPAVAFCRTCGKALCNTCKRDVMGAIYCEPCLAARVQGVGPVVAPPPPMSLEPSVPNPGIAALLGLIPGVGAMYNGQFAKALIHVGVFVVLIVATSEISGFFGILIPFWVFYMAFEAYHTAKARQLGQPAPDPLGLDRMFGLQETPPVAPANPTSTEATVAGIESPTGTQTPTQANAPTGAVVLIVLGVIFLLSNFRLLHIGKLWPVFLIGLGLWIAYKRTSQRI